MREWCPVSPQYFMEGSCTHSALYPQGACTSYLSVLFLRIQIMFCAAGSTSHTFCCSNSMWHLLHPALCCRLYVSPPLLHFLF